MHKLCKSYLGILIEHAQRKAEEINNIETLNELTLNVFLAQNPADIRRYLEEAEDKQTH